MKHALAVRIFSGQKFSALAAANLFSRLHHYLIALVISNYLAQFMNDISLGWVIAGASVVIAASLLVSPRIFTRFGTHRVLVALAIGEIGAVWGLLMAESGAVAAVFFALQGICAYNIFLGLDLLLEAQSTNEDTGRLRGIFLVISNVAVLTASLALSGILADGNFEDVFTVGIALLIPFIALGALFMPKVSHAGVDIHNSIVYGFREIFQRPSLLPTMIAHFLVLLFFAWEIYYLPLYLKEHLDFSWHLISILFAISVVPYIVFEYPLGKIADKYLGEKEITIAGFFIVAVGFASLSFMTEASPLWWAIFIFIANIGGAAVEIMTEAHFFKRVSVADSNLIGIYQMMRPLSAIAGPALASLALLIVPFPYLFAVFGGILLLGLPVSFALKDTR